jgi:hypothetical protein
VKRFPPTGGQSGGSSPRPGGVPGEAAEHRLAQQAGQQVAGVLATAAFQNAAPARSVSPSASSSSRYTYADLGSPHAMAKTNKFMVVVWASGDKADSERVVGLLRTAVGRLEKE